jgi:hypothetical protein
MFLAFCDLCGAEIAGLVKGWEFERLDKNDVHSLALTCTKCLIVCIQEDEVRGEIRSRFMPQNNPRRVYG